MSMLKLENDVKSASKLWNVHISLRKEHFQNAARRPLQYVGPGPSAPHFEHVHFEKKDRGRRPLRRTFLSEWMLGVGNFVKKCPGNFFTELCHCPEQLQKHGFGHKVWSRSRRRHHSEESFPGTISSDWLSKCLLREGPTASPSRKVTYNVIFSN